MEKAEQYIHVTDLDMWLEVNGMGFKIGTFHKETPELFAAYSISFWCGDLFMDFLLRVPGPIPKGMTIPTSTLLVFLVGCAMHKDKEPMQIAKMFGIEDEPEIIKVYVDMIRENGALFKKVTGSKYESIRRLSWS